MYKFKPFEGVKIVEDYDDAYLISVLSLPLDKYPNQSMMMRVADVKAQSQASTFLNGSNITMDMLMSTSETFSDAPNNRSDMMVCLITLFRSKLFFSL